MTKTATVVSSRFPTIAHETTGAAIHNATGSQSWLRASGTAWTARHVTTMNKAISAAAVAEYARSTNQ